MDTPIVRSPRIGKGSFSRRLTCVGRECSGCGRLPFGGGQWRRRRRGRRHGRGAGGGAGVAGFALPLAEPVLETAADRLRHWRRKLLDLTAAQSTAECYAGDRDATALPGPGPAGGPPSGRRPYQDRACAAAWTPPGGTPNFTSARTGESCWTTYARRRWIVTRSSPPCAKDARGGADGTLSQGPHRPAEGGANTLFLAIGVPQPGSANHRPRSIARPGPRPGHARAGSVRSDVRLSRTRTRRGST